MHNNNSARLAQSFYYFFSFSLAKRIFSREVSTAKWNEEKTCCYDNITNVIIFDILSFGSLSDEFQNSSSSWNTKWKLEQIERAFNTRKNEKFLSFFVIRLFHLLAFMTFNSYPLYWIVNAISFHSIAIGIALMEKDVVINRNAKTGVRQIPVQFECISPPFNGIKIISLYEFYQWNQDNSRYLQWIMFHHKNESDCLSQQNDDAIQLTLFRRFLLYFAFVFLFIFGLRFCSGENVNRIVMRRNAEMKRFLKLDWLEMNRSF